MRQPRDFWLGEELPLAGPGFRPISTAKAVWLEPPADMGRPVWRDVLEQIELGPPERAALLASVSNEPRRTHKLWGRIAAKEAARRLWHTAGSPPTYPADLAVVADQHGRPELFSLASPGDSPAAAISIAHCDGVAVAMAALDPGARVGIDVEAIADRPDGFLASAFTPGEQVLLGRWSGSSLSEWIARFWCAKEAAGKATGLGLPGGPGGCEITEVDEASGVIKVKLGPALATALAGQCEVSLHVVSARRNDYAWAWTLVEGADS
jgi:phosphopantetheinyl transferase (holo-ACP synthase)